MQTTLKDAVQMECRPGQDEFSLTLRIVSRLDHIRLVRAALGGVLAHLGVVESDANLMALAVAEILTNSIEHGLQSDSSHDLEVCANLRGDVVQISVQDDGPPLPREDQLRLTGHVVAMEEASDQWSVRGHGLQIVHSIVDSVSVLREQDRNCVVLKKTVDLHSQRRL